MALYDLRVLVEPRARPCRELNSRSTSTETQAGQKEKM